MGLSAPDPDRLRRALSGARVVVESTQAVRIPARAGNVSILSERVPLELSDDEFTDRVRLAESLSPWTGGPFPIGAGVVLGANSHAADDWMVLDSLLPHDMPGSRVLDASSGIGYVPFTLALRGAEVVALARGRHLEQARFLESLYGSGANFCELSWAEVGIEQYGRFDLIHCGSALHRERNPALLLEHLFGLLADDGKLLLGAPTLSEVELARYARIVPPSGEEESWCWIPGRLALRWLSASVGFALQSEIALAHAPAAPFDVELRYLELRRPAGAESITRRTPRAEAGTAVFDPDPVAVRFSPGHFYSPLVDTRELRDENWRSLVWPETPRATVGIDWRAANQIRLCEEILSRQARLELNEGDPKDPRVYTCLNDCFPALDAWMLEGMLRHLCPRRMIEIGGGFSTLVSSRVNREEFAGSMQLTCIDPYPSRVLVDDLPGVTELRIERVQETPLALFRDLDGGDVLFVDTSHVVKTGGDVPWIYHEVLPRLRPGVLIHIHNVFLPGDYPREWVLDGWGWNEVYLIRSMLMFSAGFEVVLGSQWMIQNARRSLLAAFPGFERHREREGSSLWIKRVGSDVGGQQE